MKYIINVLFPLIIIARHNVILFHSCSRLCMDSASLQCVQCSWSRRECLAAAHGSTAALMERFNSSMIAALLGQEMDDIGYAGATSVTEPE